MFTPEQAMFVLNWYALDVRGRFAYRRGMFRRMKGHGKDPLGAALCSVEFVGPCRFGGFRDGLPYAIPHSAAWVQTAAVSQEQTRNTTALLPAMISKRAIEEFGIELGKTLVYAHGGRARLEAVTSSPKALEGGRASFTLKNEAHWWGQMNEGHAMAAVIARNAAKSRDGASRVLSISNAHGLGTDSDAERDYNAWVKMSEGRTRTNDFLYDSLEAPADTVLEDPESLRAGLLAARGDSEWLDVDRLMAEIYDPTTEPSTARRFYLNQLVNAEDAWLAPEEWNACAAPGTVVEDREIITLGLDGSKSDDHTVLSACRVSDSFVWMIRRWAPAELPDHLIPTREVDAEVRAAFAKYDVVGFYSDRNEWAAMNLEWARDLGEGLCARASQANPVEWDMSNSKSAALMAQAYHDSIVQRMLTHSGDPVLAQYHYNARRKPTVWEGAVTFMKESPFSSNKVDAVASSALAWKARQDYLALPENRQRQVVHEAGGFFS